MKNHLSGSLSFSFFLFLLAFVSSPLRAAPAFTKEAGVRIASATPQSIDVSTSPMRMYFLRDFRVLSATSTTGLSWSEEAGIRLSSSTGGSISVSSVTGFSLLTLSAGGYHALFSNLDSSGTYRIHSATSTDGLGWAIGASTAFAPASTATFVGRPQLLKISAANWRLYFVQNTDAGSDPANRRIYTSQSINEGVAWSTAALALANQAGDVCVSTLTNANIRLIYTAPLTSETTNSQMLSAISDSVGTSFTDESGVRLSTASSSGPLSFPLVIRSSESYRWRMYYAFTAAGSTLPHVFSALTVAPDPQSVSPSAVNRTDPVTTFTISGEIFSPSPTVKITKSGQSDVSGASVSRTNDQTITMTINPLNKDLGVWAVVVTNSDARTGTLTSGITVTFAGGSVTLIDNLLRPRTGARTRIDMTIFEPGRILVTLYTLEGRLAKTLFDGDASLGTTTVYWDGKNDAGIAVASGVYLLKVEGPKLDALEKIVVIK